MKIVVHSKKEEELLRKLQDFLVSQDLEMFLHFEDPISFVMDEIFDELCSCFIEVDKNEEPIDLDKI